ncbi:hypothetical protein VEE16_44960 (plasmid) [Escherichia coli]|nr:hypothetical protein VEE16_44960 [Escherichia coli]
MREAVIAEVSTQLSEVVGVIERHLEPTLLAVHLYGSAVDGGLKPHRGHLRKRKIKHAKA